RNLKITETGRHMRPSEIHPSKSREDRDNSSDRRGVTPESEMIMAEPYVAPEDVARYIKITRRQVLQAARQGLIPAHPVSFGGRRSIWRFKMSEVDIAIAQRTPNSNRMPVADEGTMASGSPRS